MKIAGCVAAAAVAFSATDPPARRDAPNVVFFLVDTLRADALGCLGSGRPTSPVIDSLAQEGALFTRCYAQAPWTKVSVPSLLTSLYPTTNGVTAPMSRLPDEATTLAETFHAAGYRTAAFFTNPFLGAATNLRQGFDTVYEARDLLGDRKGPRSNSASSARVTERALPWIDAAARDPERRPFLLLLHSMDPHEEYRPPAPFDALFAEPARAAAFHERWARLKALDAHPAINRRSRGDLERLGIDPDAYAETGRALYDGDVAHNDREIGRVIERLRHHRLLDRTIVVVASDHGEEFLEHGRTSHGHSLYDEMLRVPLIVRVPGRAPRRIDERVALLDLMPSLLDLADVPHPRGLQGQSLAPLVLAKPGFVERPIWSERYTEDPSSGIAFARIDSAWKAIYEVKRWPAVPGPEFQLFRSDADPHDREDVAAEHPEVVKALKTEILRRYAFLPRLPGIDTSIALDPDTLDRLKALGYLR
jgi:arylsulfatase A-like enzyme